jgi:phosphoenolpyruvate-protein kinase (PTS system EI component)
MSLHFSGLGLSPGKSQGRLECLKSICLANLSESTIVAIRNVMVSDLIQEPIDYVRGIIATHGSDTSHWCIYARALAIPVIILEENEFSILCHTQWVEMDGDTGEIYAKGDFSD